MPWGGPVKPSARRPAVSATMGVQVCRRTGCHPEAAGNAEAPPGVQLLAAALSNAQAREMPGSSRAWELAGRRGLCGSSRRRCLGASPGGRPAPVLSLSHTRCPVRNGFGPGGRGASGRPDRGSREAQTVAWEARTGWSSGAQMVGKPRPRGPHRNRPTPRTRPCGLEPPRGPGVGGPGHRVGLRNTSRTAAALGSRTAPSRVSPAGTSHADLVHPSLLPRPQGPVEPHPTPRASEQELGAGDALRPGVQTGVSVA